jgi:predicted GIY-YIG superfamily endonuclease
VYQTSDIVATGHEKPFYSFNPYQWAWQRSATVYLLHFDAPICPTHPARHYLGWTHNLAERLELHRCGRGARLTQVALERGIGWRLARTWTGDRAYERLLKNRKNAPKLCPLCQQAQPVIVDDGVIPF